MSGLKQELIAAMRRMKLTTRDLCVSSSVRSPVTDALERAAQDATDFDYDIGW